VFYAGKIPGTRLAELKAKYALLHNTLVSLLEDKKLIEKEYRKIPKSSDADKKIKALRDSCEDLRKETTQRRQEIKTLKDDLFARHKRLTKEHKELEELFRKQEELKDELVRLQAIPIQLGKDMEKISRRIQLKKSDWPKVTQLPFTAEEKEGAIKEVEGKKALLEIKEREFNTQTKVHEMNKENEGTAISERGMLEMGFRNVSNLKQKLHDTLSRMQREKEKDLRTFKKMEMQLKIAQESLLQVQGHHERMLLEIDAVPKDDGAILERRRELQREVEIAKRNLTQE
ncbi:coiled-coil domain-containing protein 146, partial [Protobothrops mucrosquamatus]|uniref:coiled-coil domain-containing protein 146 n=1 Tax=Protobothrops mucrosquamatus TaxID=103944 RepID=UPI0007757969